MRVIVLSLCLACVLSSVSATQPATITAMQNMYNDMNGDSTWLTKYGWDGTRGADPCDPDPTDRWYGVVCTSNEPTSLTLGYNGLTGPLSPEVGNIPQLVNLIVSANSITSLPDELGNLANLEVIYADQNDITAIPSGLGTATNLEKLFLDRNEITGSIPDELCTLNNLEQLRLNENSISGSIPSCFDQLSSLATIDVADNNLGGTLPDFLADLPLAFVDLSDNAFTGAIPEYWSNFQPATLDVSGNNFACRMPYWMSLSRTTTIEADGNRFWCPPQNCPSCITGSGECTSVTLDSFDPTIAPPGTNVDITGKNFGFCPNFTLILNSSITVYPTVTAGGKQNSAATFTVPTVGKLGATLAKLVHRSDLAGETTLSNSVPYTIGNACPGDSTCSGPDHGTCDITIGECDCVNQWRGDECEERPPCKCVNGECDYSDDKANGAGGVCICDDKWGGDKCDVEKTILTTKQKKAAAGVGIGVSIGVIAACLVGALAFWYHRKTLEMKQKLIDLNAGAFGDEDVDYTSMPDAKSVGVDADRDRSMTVESRQDASLIDDDALPDFNNA